MTLLADIASPTFHRLDIEPAAPGWTCFNPTLLSTHDGLLGIVRSSNYRIVECRYVIPPEDGEDIRTANILLRLADDLTVSDARTIAVDPYQGSGFPVHGLEDCRLRHTGNGIGVSATVRNIAGFDGRCRIATAELDVDAARLHSLRVIESNSSQEHEKNWMPLAGKAAWLYCANVGGYTLTVEEKAGFPGEYRMLRREPSPDLAAEFRGGSQLVPFRGGWLCVIHEVRAGATGPRVYEHRLCWFTLNLRLERVSERFAVREQEAIDFAAGLAIAGGRVVISFGVRDAEAWLVSLTEDDAWQLVKPIPQHRP